MSVSNRQPASLAKFHLRLNPDDSMTRPGLGPAQRASSERHVSDSENSMRNATYTDTCICIRTLDFCTCCDGPIFLPDRATIAASRPYHTDHVRCRRCGDVILESYYPETTTGGNCDLYCPTCYVDLKADKCSRCQKSITGQMVTVEANTHFHPSCFTCQGLDGQDCGASLLDGYHRQETRMVCSKCYKRSKMPRCSKCKELIDGESDKGMEYVVLNGSNLHVSCFVCEVRSETWGSVCGKGSWARHFRNVGQDSTISRRTYGTRRGRRMFATSAAANSAASRRTRKKAASECSSALTCCAALIYKSPCCKLPIY